ncbi:[4Fe-4S] proteins maturation [Yamadazyma tenuis]|uniref:HesB-like domain-containing protein n=1 Tax=Candida tenuis (strain ATCC 10573 / BCRC 21748 / CBS 615 / JCM 9827 / NBRC 10315 / NRRL Y-1498 / VKM Y-70) TaxID=590646 RepID=G3B3B5_CANTC|nr:HesB-like domain-containing protein [Yamadazyma tenuis ATCC 10573]EGV64128.1 HesB-like domain-containing protein [Yamadazyma tenuis ATCC 10573]WEJ96236.1 [4Fe-4S] proteins maturation [Yamadazyma tenuis]
MYAATIRRSIHLLRPVRPIRVPIYPTRRLYSVEPRTLKAATLKPAVNDFAKTRLVSGQTNMKIAITERAGQKLSSIAEKDNNPNSVLLIKVESGGCHGFQYDIKLTDLKEELTNNPDLLVFKRSSPSNAQIVIDESSLQILQDSKLDYTTELIGSQFKVVESPYTTSACGCGSSFDFDFDKLAQKQGESI